MTQLSFEKHVKGAVIKAGMHHPSFSAVSYWEAILPVNVIDVTCVVLEPSRLSPTAEFCLKLIHMNIDTSHKLEHYLSLDTDVIVESISELMEHRLVRNNYRPEINSKLLSVTEPGQSYLREKNKINISRRRKMTVHLNGLTGNMQAKDKAKRVQDVTETGIYTLPKIVNEDLDIRDFDPKVLNIIANETESFDGTVANIKALTQRYTEYLPGYLVLQLVQKETAQERLVVFRESDYLEEETQALNRSRNSTGESLTPEDAHLLHPAPPVAEDPLPSFTDTERELSRDIAYIDGQIFEAELQNDKDKIIKSLKSERDQAAKDLEKIQQGEVWLSNSSMEARKGLCKAIDDANYFVVMICPWISPDAVNGNLLASIKRAFRRDVYVDIVWGFGSTRKTRDIQAMKDIERKNASARSVFKRLNDAVRNNKSHLFRNFQKETHEKILVTDKLVAHGSFNFLNYDGSDTNRADSLEFSHRESDRQMYIDQKLKRNIPFQRHSQYLK